jgi:hypothetical protein
MSAPCAAAQLLRMLVSLGSSLRQLLRGRGRRSAPSLPSRERVELRGTWTPAVAAAFALDSSREDRPKGYMALSHSSFQASGLYVFSGARPSSGAATSACSKATDFTDTPLALDAAAPGDGLSAKQVPRLCRRSLRLAH